ncbi:cupin domain-containing protein [Streptacidiphilus sp. N1-12]|uniref:Cupin domain-containing protein n=2 Tax=Streptacidiphilus alkalitolerans TaxID=3342712 RepID=A0ABV6VK61_9ACTN
MGGVVHFTPGSRTAWHTHPTGQAIFVTEGVGLIRREGGPVEEVRPGDRVSIGPGENHGHGASPACFHSQIAYQAAGESRQPHRVGAPGDRGGVLRVALRRVMGRLCVGCPSLVGPCPAPGCGADGPYRDLGSVGFGGRCLPSRRRRARMRNDIPSTVVLGRLVDVNVL